MITCRDFDCDSPAVWAWTPWGTRLIVPLCDEHAAGIDLSELREITHA